jgi:hypothetical protein
VSCEFANSDGSVQLAVRVDVYAGVGTLGGDKEASEQYYKSYSRVPVSLSLGYGEAAQHFMSEDCGTMEIELLDVNASYTVTSRADHQSDTATCLTKAEGYTKAAFDAAQPR